MLISLGLLVVGIVLLLMASEPQPALLARKKLIEVGAEGTPGTLASTMTGIAANYYDVKCEPGDAFSEGDRQPSGNYVGRVAAIRGELMGTCSYKQDVAPSLGLGTASGFIPILLAAGYSSGHPASSLAGQSTFSLNVYEEGRRKRLTGAMCNITLDFEDGKKLVANYNWSGLWAVVADAAMPSQAPLTSTSVYVCRSVTLTVATLVIAKINKITLDLGAIVEKREDMTSGFGIAHYVVSDILPSGSFDPEARKVADQDQYGLWLAGGTAALAISLTGGANTLSIAAPALQRKKITDAKRGNRLVDEIAFDLCNSSGDDAVTISEA